MNDPSSNSENWNACPHGEVQRLAARLRRRRADRKWARFIGATGALVVVVLASGIAVKPFLGTGGDPYSRGGITCAEVQANIRQYAGGRLEPQLAERIRVHLEQCPECGSAFRQMMAEMQKEVSFRDMHVPAPGRSRTRSLPAVVCRQQSTCTYRRPAVAGLAKSSVLHRFSQVLATQLRVLRQSLRRLSRVSTGHEAILGGVRAEWERGQSGQSR